MKEIQLTKGRIAIVDDEDYPELSKYKWSACKVGNTFYAVRDIRDDGKHILVYMHRVVICAPRGTIVDHRDLDGLNNQRGNLRICTITENNANSRLSSANKSGFKGVHLAYGKWRAQIKFRGKVIYLGMFSDKVEAAQAYKKAADKYFGEFARLK